MRGKHELIPSRAMGRRMHVWCYGHYGAPVLAFPSASGMAHEWDANGMVVIFGAGPIANAMCEMAKAKGAGTVVLVGTRDYRLDAARGADVKINIGTGDTKYPCKNLAEAVVDLNGGELPRSVIVATGAASAIEQGWELGGRRSTVVIFGLMVLVIPVGILVAYRLQRRRD